MTSSAPATPPQDFQIKTLDQLKRERATRQGELSRQGELTKEKSSSTSQERQSHLEASLDDLQTRNGAGRMIGSRKLVLVRRTVSKDHQKLPGSREGVNDHVVVSEECGAETAPSSMLPRFINSEIDSISTPESDSEPHSAPELGCRGSSDLETVRRKRPLHGEEIRTSSRKRTRVSLVRRRRKGEESAGVVSSEEDNLLDSRDIGKSISISDLKNEL